MKFLLGLPLMLGGICGIGMSFAGNIIVDFPYFYPQAIQMSMSFGVFSIIVLVSGVYVMFVSN